MLSKALVEPLPQRGMRPVEFMEVPGGIHEERDHAPPVIDADELGAGPSARAVHVVVVAQRDAYRAGDVAEGVEDRPFAGAAGHERPLECEALPRFRQGFAALHEVIAEGTVEDADP